MPAETPDEGDKLMYDTLSASYIEHDSFTLFNLIMKNAWEWYAAIGKTKVSENGRVIPPIVIKARKIQEQYLRKVDPELEKHLRSLDIEPQMWGIRWIRLLFGREFGFSQMLSVWDCLFAADGHSLDIVDFVCVAMLLRIRDQLLLADYTGVLTLLLRYPVDDSMTANSFIEDALYLQAHCTAAGGRRIIKQYSFLIEEEVLDSQQPLQIVNGGLTPSMSRSEYQRRAIIAANNVEQRMQGIAKNVYESSEKWTGDMNKFVRQKVQDARVRAEKAIQSGGVHYLTAENSGIRAMPYTPQKITYVNGNGSGGIARSRASLAAAQAVVKTRPRPGSSAGNSFDEAEYTRERNEALAEVLSTSLAVFDESNVEGSSKYKEAIERIEYVRKCLLFEDMRVAKKYKQPIGDSFAIAQPEKNYASSSSANPLSNGTREVSSLQPVASRPISPVRVPVAVPAAPPRIGMPRPIKSPALGVSNGATRGRSANSSPTTRAISNSPNPGSLPDPLADFSLNSGSAPSLSALESSQSRPVSSEYARYNNSLKEQQPSQISREAIDMAKAMLFGSLDDNASSPPSSLYSPSSSPMTASPPLSLSSSINASTSVHPESSNDISKITIGAANPLFNSPPPKSTNTAILSTSSTSSTASTLFGMSPNSPSVSAEEAKKLLLGL